MFKVSAKNVKNEKGIVYILELDIDDTQIVKVGVTNRNKVEDRVCEILASAWKKYRIFPKCYVKRYRHFDNPYEIETIMHNVLNEYSYKPKHVFSGSTELFDIPLDIVVGLYEILYDGGSREDVESRLREYTNDQTDEGGVRDGGSADRPGDAEMVVSGQGVESIELEEVTNCSEDLEN